MLDEIIHAIRSGRIRITDHADEEMVADALNFNDVCGSVEAGEIIEDYPSDLPYPSCLVHGETSSGVAVHSVWAYNKNSRWAALVTAYRPDPERWIGGRIRRNRP